MQEPRVRKLYADEYVEVTYDERRGLVRYERTAAAFPTIEVLRETHAKLSPLLATMHHQKPALLVDVRAAKARNDEAFEREIARAVTSLFPSFRAHATLVKSAVGRLQVRRLATARGDSAPSVFSDEAEALAYLQIS